MNNPGFLPTPPPPEDADAADLTDYEVEHAIETSSSEHLIELLARALSPGEASIGKGDARYALSKQEIRRRRPYLYLRSTLVCPGEPAKVLVYRVNWLQPSA